MIRSVSSATCEVLSINSSVLKSYKSELVHEACLLFNDRRHFDVKMAGEVF